MKFIGHQLGRIIVLFPTEEVRPTKGVPMLDMLTGIKERYKFVKLPDVNNPTFDPNKEGHAFKSGSFLYKEEKIAIDEFTIYNDGISVSCFHTKFADAFFEDVILWAKETFDLREFAREPRKIYRSQIVVEFDKSLNQLVKDFSVISHLVQLAYSQYTGHDNPINLNRIDFRMDDTKVRGVTPVSFGIERRIDISHDTERYISEASIPSDPHLQLLQSIEDNLA